MIIGYVIYNVKIIGGNDAVQDIASEVKVFIDTLDPGVDYYVKWQSLGAALIAIITYYTQE